MAGPAAERNGIFAVLRGVSVARVVVLFRRAGSDASFAFGPGMSGSYVRKGFPWREGQSSSEGRHLQATPSTCDTA